MKKSTFGILIILCCLSLCSKVAAQVYVEYGEGAYPLDICNCQLGAAPLNEPAITSYSMATSPAGDVYYVDTYGIVRIDAMTGDTSFVAGLPVDYYPVSMVYGDDGLIYTSATGFTGPFNETLIATNPVTGISTILGDLPAGYTLQGDLFFYQGQLYGLAVENNTAVSMMLQIPIANPAATTVYYTFPSLYGLIGGIDVVFNGVETVFMLGFNIFTNQFGLYQVNMSTGAATLFCPGIEGGDLAAPPNFVLNCCTNYAGNLSTLDLTTACQNQSITLTHLGDEILNPDAALSFVLVADTTSVLPNGIVQISADPTFSFDAATMNVNQIYFVAPVAAPGPAGNPDWLAGCFDVGFFAPVQWLATPTVSFSIAQNDVCAGECQNVAVSFTGTPPFNLTYNSPFGQQTQIFLTPSGVLSVCPPAGFSGALTVEAVSLADANCVCE